MRLHVTTHLAACASRMEQLWREGSLCDCTLMCDGGSIDVHKIVLAAQSPFFHALFSERWQGAQDVAGRVCMEVGGILLEDLDTLLRAVYSHTLDLTPENIVAVLSASCQLDVSAVKTACCEVRRNAPRLVCFHSVRAVVFQHWLHTRSLWLVTDIDSNQGILGTSSMWSLTRSISI